MILAARRQKRHTPSTRLLTQAATAPRRRSRPTRTARQYAAMPQASDSVLAAADTVAQAALFNRLAASASASAAGWCSWIRA